ncbi:MAG: 2-phosphosulfolactate phosphatase family protein [Gloeomargaritaceae cyanobacterium C42_A2020_066]|nr:2-phosphosulfolactate phosphatase family protein [Gloeomargaritaceae cyanobacterium C42_A2020_066]
MSQVFVYHTPELVPDAGRPDCAVVVDVLRATTTMATALQAGAEAVQVFSDLQQLLDVSATWPDSKRLRVGERGGRVVEGFDMGNSPLDCTPACVGGKRLFMSTTNGTRSLARVQASPAVVTAALVNRQAVVDWLVARRPAVIWIVGSGWEGSYSLEDTVCAGAILASLETTWGIPASELTANDEAVAALALFQQAHTNLLQLLHQASHGRRLLGLGYDADLKYCAQLDSIPVVPQQREPGVLVLNP